MLNYRRSLQPILNLFTCRTLGKVNNSIIAITFTASQNTLNFSLLYILLKLYGSEDSVRNIRICGCGSVGRVVASGSRGPQFESSHWQIKSLNVYCQLYWKDENKEKEAMNGPFLKKTLKNGPTPSLLRKPASSYAPSVCLVHLFSLWPT